LVQQEKLASLGALTAGIAHEIKNPLNFVTNFAGLSRELVDELAEETDPDEREAILDDLQENARKIEEHGRRADAIVRGMMEHARSRPGDRRTVDLNRLVREYADLAWHGFHARHPEARVDLSLDLAPEAGEVEVASAEIGRVLINLLDNAFDAVTEADAPTVSVSTTRDSTGVAIHVRDTGTGMTEAVRSRVFEPFFTTKATGEGTGLGLSLSHDIAVAHHGTLTVESAEGQGTTFTLRLPASG
ncbi:MAG: ATP-binding protein, partial [Bacteroidota bacterium]